MKSILRSLVAIVLVFGAGCQESLSGVGGSDDPGPAKAAIVSQSARAVGDACNSVDGWTPAPLPLSAPIVGGKPVAIAVLPGRTERHQLATGVGFCLPPGGIYPNGYFTMNCTTDSDCLGSARCDGELCREPCSRDSECGSGTRCRGGDASLRYCTGDPPRSGPGGH
jgi:hypothetical protein